MKPRAKIPSLTMVTKKSAFMANLLPFMDQQNTTIKANDRKIDLFRQRETGMVFLLQIPE